jgi:ABC-type spermidine/putrescine transport system permease subunit II
MRFRRLLGTTAWLFGWAALLLLLSPILYTGWVSFTPGELLVPPVTGWSLRWYQEFFADRRWLAALRNSLIVAGLSVTGSLLTGLPLAYALARWQFRGRSLLGQGVLLPLSIPPVVLGIGLLPTVHALGLWGSPLALASAHALLGLPLVCLLTRAALEAAGPDLEWAARGLGATPWRAVRRVTLPLIRPAVLAGALLTFVLSLNEFVLSLFLAVPETETLPRVIWPSLRYSVSPLAGAASTVTLAMTALLGTLIGWLWLRRR